MPSCGMNGFCLLFSFILFIHSSCSATMKDTNDIRDLILTNYSSETLPRLNQSSVLDIKITVYLRAIIDLDEPKGEMTTTMGFGSTWLDESLQWDPLEYGNQSEILVEDDKLWTPNLMLANPGSGNALTSVGQQKATVRSSGQVSNSETFVFNTLCDINVQYFPFDLQICHVKLSTWEYGSLLKFKPVPSMDLITFIENGVWSLIKTEVRTEDVGYAQDVIATVHLERRSLFYALNFLAPILILVLLNTAVFLLPADSGERMGFSVTILLSVAVYMTIISDKLPETSNPIACISFVLITYLLQSTSICIEAVVCLWYFHRDDSKPVGEKWAENIACTRRDAGDLHGSKKDSMKIKPVDSDGNQNAVDVCFAENKDYSTDSNDKITWKMVSKSLDRISLYWNIALTFFVSVVYFIVVTKR